MTAEKPPRKRKRPIEQYDHKGKKQRRTLQRVSVAVETPLGPIRVKVARLNGRTLNAAPEYDDCQKIAAVHGIPLKRVLAEAAFQFQKQNVKE